MTASRGRRRRTGATLVAVAALALAGCTEDDAEQPDPSGARGSDEPALALVPYSRWSDLAFHDCASLGRPGAVDDRPVLLWLRVRVTEPVRIRPMAMDVTTHGLEYVRQYVAPDPGPAAPHAAVSLGRTPRGERLDHDTEPIGDPRQSRAGVAAATRAFERRERLAGQRLGVGDHYLFAEITLQGPATLNGLSVTWNEPGERRQLTPVGWLLFRGLCGG